MLEITASNILFRSIALVVIFGIVTLLTYAIARFVSRRMRAAKNLAELQEGPAIASDGHLANRTRDSAWARLTERIERTGVNLKDTRNHEIVRLLKSAGYDAPSAPQVYTLTRVFMIFLLPCLFLLLVSFADEPPETLTLYLVSSILALLGLYIPNLFVRSKAHRRREAIVNGFPDSLDLMLVCVEAGLGLEASLDRVSREMVEAHPLVAELLLQTTLMMRAGATREDSLRKLSEVSGVDEIKSFATLLIQSDKLGTSIATTLRVYSSEMREARRMRAEEKAHRLPVLISIPLVVFMLPTMIGVLALPAVILAIREVIPALVGGG